MTGASTPGPLRHTWRGDFAEVYSDVGGLGGATIPDSDSEGLELLEKDIQEHLQAAKELGIRKRGA